VGRIGDAMALITGLHFHWTDSGRAAEGQTLAEEALAHAAEGVRPELRARTMLTASEMAFRQGDQAAATTWATAAIETGAEHDPVTAALAEVNLARVAFRDGDAERIESLSRAALDRAGQDRRIQRAAYHMLAWAAHTAGDRGRAIEWFERSLVIRQAMRDPFGVAVELANLGEMAMEAGDLARAADWIHEALTTATRLENLYLLTSLIGSAGALAGAAGSHADAMTLLAAADAAYDSTSLVPDPSTREMLDTASAKAREQLDPEAAEAAIRSGRALTIADAASRAMLACARTGHRP
jgi:tetratricopeptide (TPR) repeat protein